MHLALLVTNTDDSAFAARHPRDGEKFAAMIAQVRPDWRVTVFDLPTGQFPPDDARFDGWMIGGSPASVHDAAPWIARLLDLIRQLAAQKTPVFAACFGHQAVALALGGQVRRNPAGWKLGLAEMIVGPNPWLPPGPLRQYAAHLEQVTRLPDGAWVLASSDHCPVAAFAIGGHVLTTQYHPEMTHGFITALVDEIAPKLPSDVGEAAKASLGQQADTAAFAESIVRFFKSASPARPADPSP
jgi:GMP synthase-like glutamine amidotransferase